MTQIKKIVALSLASIPLVSGADSTPYFPEPNPPVAVQADILTKSNSERSLVLRGTPTSEWLFHKTSDNQHPNGEEQVQLWLLNRGRQNPTAEGVWLATASEPEVATGRNYFNVDINQLKNEFAGYPAKPPAAFDARLYQAAKKHSQNLIARDSQDHNGQLELINAEGFQYRAFRGNVFSYADNGFNAHAGFNIDWGNGLGGMQDGRGHRQALQAIEADYTNVGIAMLEEKNNNTEVGPWVTTGNFAQAQDNIANHYNRFLVGTVWEDLNNNDRYDPGEGLAGVTVLPDQGTYFAVTSAGGGYSIPITENGTYQVNFSGGGLDQPVNRSVVMGSTSVLLDYEKTDTIILDPNSDPTPDPDSTFDPDPAVTPTIQFNQTNTDHTTTSVALDSDFTSPVAILGPPEYRGQQAAVSSILSLTKSQLQYKVQEWNYLDQGHLKEKVPYLILNAGKNIMPDGSTWELGTFQVKGTGQWHSVNFNTQSNQKPYLFLTLQTHHGSELISLRAKDVDNTGFNAALFEQESLMNGHIPELGGYLAIFPSQNQSEFSLPDNSTLKYSLQRLTVRDYFTQEPGGDLLLKEEASKDEETRHVAEQVDILRLNGYTFAQITSFIGGDTVSLRKQSNP